MKRYLLFIISMFCVSIGTWADVPTGATAFGENNDSYYIIDSKAKTITVHIATQGDMSSYPNNPAPDLTGLTRAVITGKVHSYKTGASNGDGSDGALICSTFKDLVVDFSGATLTPIEDDYTSNFTGYCFGGQAKNIIVPNGANPATFEIRDMYNSYAAADGINFYSVSGTTINAAYNSNNNKANLEAVSASAKTLKVVKDFSTTLDLGTVANSDITTIDLTGITTTGNTSTNAITVPGTATTVICSSAGVAARITPSTNVLSTEISCDASELATKVSALTTKGYKPISITLTGTLTSALLTSFGGTAYSEVTRIDLGQATLASGAAVTDLSLPSTLQELVLPKGQTVSGDLQTRISANSNLWYVYSQTTTPQTFIGQTAADYVWVAKPGGLARALDNEASLRTAVYVKIASTVALSETDAEFGNHGISATSGNANNPWQFIDLSDAVVTEAATLVATAPHSEPYRIILPNNLTGDNMAIFASNAYKGDVVGLYSYSGTTLKILGLSKDYNPIALKDARIVRSGTEVVEFVQGFYNSTDYGIFTPSMLAAINNAGKTTGFTDQNGNDVSSNVITGNENVGNSIRSFRILTPHLNSDNDNVSSYFTALTFTNPLVTTLNLTGVKDNTYGANQAVINLNGCTSLQGLNLDGVHAASVTANCNTLQTIGMSNVAIEGDVSFQGAIQTAFVASGRIAGNIDLTNNNKLGSIDIVNVEFKDASSNSTLQGNSLDGNLTTGDLIITRQYNSTNVTSSEDANWTATYGTTNDTYTAIIGKIRTSDTFGTGLTTSGKDGRIYPQISAVATPPYSANVAGYEKNGCAISLTLDGTTEHYTKLSEALSFIATEAGETLSPCNLTINTTAKDSNPRYNLTNDDIMVINSVSFSAVAEGGDNANMYRDATLNLHGATLASDVSGAIANTSVHNIIMPKGLDKDVIKESNFSGCTNLNGVISLNDQRTALVAYVNKPGTLRQVLQQVAAFRPNVYNYMQNVNLPSVTLSGKLLASDIATNYEHLEGKAGKIGNFAETPEVNASSQYIAAFENLATLRNLDISNAVFVDATDETTIKEENMTLSQLGWGGIVSLKMPTNENMKKVPANFLENCQHIPYLCIPYNYEEIGNAAFYLAGTYWITTTDSQGAEIDNGIYTYTFSKNMEKIGSDPGTDSNGYPNVPEKPVFGAVTSGQVSDVYILRNGYEDLAAGKTGAEFSPTKCWRGGFTSGMTYGWGGFDGGNIYCREKYKNGSFLFTILHYPDQASLPTGYNSDDQYQEMQKSYTDITKQYTKKDQTGALDANGNLIPWPTFAELGRAYNQAIRNLVWDDWTPVYGENPDGNIAGGTINFNPASLPEGVSTASTLTRFNDDFVGWHEFVLSTATYVAPDEIVKKNVVYREYQDAQYFTFCVPFDMTPAEVLNLLGVPASTDEVKTIIGGFTFTDDTPNETPNAADQYPKIYTLKSVEREMKSGGANSVKLNLSRNLATFRSGNDVYEYFKPDRNNVATGSYESNTLTYDNGNKTARGADVMIRGGYPYLIKAYLPKGASIERGSLGKYVLQRYAFSMDASTAVRQRTGCYIALKGLTYDSYFARPYDQHLVRAVFKGVNENSFSEATTDGDGKHGETPYYYRFMGQFWDQYMPVNSYYLYHGDHKWYFNDKYNDWAWLPYTCLINPCTGSNYDEDSSIIPSSNVNDSEGHSVFTQNLKLMYATDEALDDTKFPSSSTAREYSFVFDDGDIMDIGENDSNTTAIDRLDGVDILPVYGNVYNMNGQHVGNSLNGLPKGLYIIKGKKVVIK